jgi:hypothetical protein
MLTTPPRTGKMANTIAINKSVTTTGGLWGSLLKMWWISGSCPYRETSYVGTGSFGLRARDS